MAKRRIGPPLVTPGAQYDFFVLMQDLVLRHGDHPLEELARRVLRSRQVIHRALRGPDLPSRDLVKAIVEGLFSEESDGDDQREAENDAIAAWTEAVADRTRRCRERAAEDHAGANAAQDAAKQFAEKLRALRDQAGRPTLKNLERTVFVSRSSMSDWFTGKSLPHSPHAGRALVKALNASPEDSDMIIELLIEARRQRKHGPTP